MISEKSLPIIPAGIARIFFAVALVGFGFQQFIFKIIIIGRPPAWPTWLPEETIFAYITGLLIVSSGLAIIINRWAVQTLMATGIFVLAWAGLQNVYLVVAHLDLGANLTFMGKSLTLGFGALLTATTFRHDENYNASIFNSPILKLASWCRYGTGLFLFFSGVQHFLYAEFVQSLVPSWIPGGLFWTYFAGAALAAAGLGLITGIKAHLAATLAGWMVLTWLIILHIPRAIAMSNQNEWTAVFEALAITGVLFMLSDSLKKK
ncbi:MAG: hypothetical protein HOP08_07000 [Cyclobacteriaceae bacterium]|nr:hypothetical protein [Cyclobacteriaceae bacterium]